MEDFSKYKWDKEFRARIIASSLQPNWFVRYGMAVVKDEYFETEHEREMVKFINAFYDTYKRPPDDDELYAEFTDNKSIYDTIDLVLEFIDDDLTYAQDMAIQFAREQAVILATMQNVGDIQDGKFSRLVERVEDALNVGKDMHQLGIDFKDVRSWAPRVTSFVQGGRILTGIQHLDMALKGGLPVGGYTIFLGGTNVGKTQTLINVGVGAASIVQRANVTHITLELAEEIITKRYSARITDYFYDPDQDSYKEYIEDLEHMLGVRMPQGNVNIKGFPSGKATLDDIESHLDALEAVGYKTDILLIDYADIMKHAKVGELRHDLSNTTVGLRSLAQDRKIAVVSASQSNREGLSAEFLDLHNMAEDIGKAFNTDLVLALCQTRLEYEKDLLRIFCAKNNDGPKGWVVNCVLKPESHATLSTELMTFSELLKAQKDARVQEENEVKEQLEKTVNKKRGKRK